MADLFLVAGAVVAMVELCRRKFPPIGWGEYWGGDAVSICTVTLSPPAISGLVVGAEPLVGQKPVPDEFGAPCELPIIRVMMAGDALLLVCTV